MSCGYVKAADVVDRFGDPEQLDPELDPDIVGSAASSRQAEYDGDDEFRKTAAVMKMVISGYAGAGTIEMGGYDYHGQGRSTGEVRDFRAGRCMGACLEYAARRGVPLMLYVFSDGSLSADGQVDNTADGRGKFMWSSDNQSTAASFFLVYNPNGRATLLSTGPGARRGTSRSATSGRTRRSRPRRARRPTTSTCWSRPSCSTTWRCTASRASSATRFPGHGLGSAALQDSLIAFNQIVSGTIAWLRCRRCRRKRWRYRQPAARWRVLT